MALKLSPAPPALEDKIVFPGDGRYGLLRSTYTTVAGPAAVLLPENTGQVVAALRYTREQGLPLSVRSGGHGLSGRSTNDGGVVIDLSAMNRVEVIERAERIVRVEAGAHWASAPRELSTAVTLLPHGRTLVASITAVVAAASERQLRGCRTRCRGWPGTPHRLGGTSRCSRGRRPCACRRGCP